MPRFLDFGFGHLEAGNEIGPACWPHFDLLAVHHGELSLTLNHKKSVDLRPGDALLIYPHTPFEGICINQCRFSVQHVELVEDDLNQATSPMLAVLKDRREGYQHYFFSCPGPLERDIERAVRLALSEQTPTIHALRVAQFQLIIAELNGEIEAPATQVQAGWQPLVQWIESHLGDSVSLDQMAKVMDMSTSHFRSRFRESFGMPAGQYVKQMRMDLACRLLRETKLPIKQIAVRVGYQDLSNFYRAFRHAMDLSPAEYRHRWAIVL